MASEIELVVAFDEPPSVAAKDFTQGKIVSGDVLLGAGKALLSAGELVHDGEPQVMLFGGEAHGSKGGRILGGGFPTDLTSQPRLVPGRLDVVEVIHEEEEESFEDVPVVGAASEEGAKPEVGALGFVDVDGGEVALAGGGDVEAQAELGALE